MRGGKIGSGGGYTVLVVGVGGQVVGGLVSDEQSIYRQLAERASASANVARRSTDNTAIDTLMG